MTEAGIGRRFALGDSVGLFGTILLSYFTGAVLAWKAFGSAVGPAFFYPAAGVTSAAMMLITRSRWPIVVLAIVIGEVLVDLHFGNTVTMAAGYAVANVVEPIVGASLTLAWCRGVPDLRVRRDLAGFLVGACAVAPVFGGLIGGTVTAWIFQSDWLAAVLQWWAGDAIGVLVAATPILLWAKQYSVLRARPVETSLVLILAVALSVGGFWSQAQPAMLILPILAWAAFRLGMLGTALAGTVIAFVATIMTSRGHGIVAEMYLSPPSQLAVTQLFVGVLLIVSLLAAQEAAARLQAVRDREAELREQVRLRTLADLAQRLSVALTPGEIGRALEDHVLNQTAVTALRLGLVSRDGHRLEWVTMAGHPEALPEQFSTGLPLDVHTRGADTSWPLVDGAETIGTLQLMWSTPQSLDEAQYAYFSAVSTLVGQALVRARGYADEQARAAVLQSAVLPEFPAATERLEVFVGYEPADTVQGVCGDWYDVLALPGNRTYLAIGDVVGHGLPAVEDMAQLRSAARAFVIQGLDPPRILAELNSFTRHTSKGRFATMAVALFDPATGEFSYGLAGHPPPLLRRGNTGAVVRLSAASGPALGPIPAAVYSAGSERLTAGDMVVFYTDGLVERPGRDIETGISAAADVIAGWGLGDSLSRVSVALHRTLAPHPRVDDVCSMVLRVTDEQHRQPLEPRD